MPVAVSKLVKPKFIDHYPKHRASGYSVTNEEPEIFNELLGKQTFEKVAAISSSGEILLAVLLHRTKQLVAVDHSYASLSAAYLKTLLLQKMKLPEILDQLKKLDYKQLDNTSAELWSELPQELRGQDSYCTNATSFNYNWPALRREWHISMKKVRATKKAIAAIEFIHGDLTDLVGLYGDFDLLYISNAMEHVGREGRKFGLQHLNTLVRPNGIVLYTSGLKPGGPQAAPGWDLVHTQLGLRTSWHYNIAQRINA